MTEYEFIEANLPAWIEPDSFEDLIDLRDLQHGGCASGCYMPAVTYRKALATMAEYGDDIFDYIENSCLSVQDCAGSDGWAQMACNLVSAAVELWASEMIDRLENEEHLDDE